MFEQSQMETELTDVDQIAVRQKTNNDRQKAANGSATAANGSVTLPLNGSRSEYTPRAVTAVVILNFINLLNYADRGTVAGVATKLEDVFGVNKTAIGTIQTVFIVAYMLLAPLFGYLGDRYNRKILMIVGIALWSAATFGGSFADDYWLFIFWRCAVGVGEASYSTIAPTIIADLFTGKRRSLMLAAFYIAIPIGSGIGFGIATLALHEKLFNDWRWAFRLTPAGGIVCCLLLLFLLQEPKRGEAEDPTDDDATSDYKQELKELCRNKTFVLATLGFTTITFSVGALQFWTPTVISYAAWNGGWKPDYETLYFSGIVIVGGLGGTAAGSLWATHWKRTNTSADPHVCAIGGLVAGPLTFVAMLFLDISIYVFWFLLLFIMIALCLNWAVVVDITTYVVPAHYRSTAVAFQTLLSHLLGDAISPTLIGSLADKMIEDNTTYYGLFIGCRYALYVTCFVTVFGGLFFLFASIYLPEDKKKVEMRGKLNEAVRDIVDVHEEELRRDEARYQSRLYREKVAAAAAKRKMKNGVAVDRDTVLMRYVRKTSSMDGEVNLGFAGEEEEEERNASEAKARKRMRPVTQI